MLCQEEGLHVHAIVKFVIRVRQTVYLNLQLLIRTVTYLVAFEGCVRHFVGLISIRA